MALYSYTCEEAVGEPFLILVPSDRSDQVAHLLPSKLAEGATTIGFINRYATKAGGWRWIDWNARIAPDEQLISAPATDRP